LLWSFKMFLYKFYCLVLRILSLLIYTTGWQYNCAARVTARYKLFSQVIWCADRHGQVESPWHTDTMQPQHSASSILHRRYHALRPRPRAALVLRRQLWFDWDIWSLIARRPILWVSDTVVKNKDWLIDWLNIGVPAPTDSKIKADRPLTRDTLVGGLALW